METYLTRRANRRQLALIPSTPRAGGATPLCLQESPITTVTRRKKRSRLNYTEEMDQTVPEEANHRTEARWKVALAAFLRFIDDGFCLSRINFENSYGFEVNGVKHRVKQAVC